MAFFPKFIFIFMFFLLFSNSITSSSSSSSTCLGVSPDKFLESAEQVGSILQQLHSILSPFNNNTSRDGISVCLDLLVMSVGVQGKDKRGTGNLSSDLRTWLSAVLANADTCIEGLEEGVVDQVKSIVSKELDRVVSLVETLLAQVIPVHVDQVDTDQFPSWITEEDKMLLSGNSVRAPDAVVATDGTGHYLNVTAAIQGAPSYSFKRYVIYVKRGVYLNESVRINLDKWNIMLVGDGIGATVISGSRNNAAGYKTFETATFAVDATGFIACNLSFENTAGPSGKMAVAFRSDSDLSIIYRCGISSYQDSLYPHSGRQFYKECRITGTVDFICGDAAAVFQNCQILARQGFPGQQNVITAQSRKSMNRSTGFSFQFCNISADTGLKPTTQTYLGRPWQAYSRTVFMQSYMSSVISPEGWIPWNESKLHLDTLTYGEYKNFGPGAKVGKRVKWPGYHVLNESQARKFTVAELIEGDLWLPASGITYTGGLSV